MSTKERLFVFCSGLFFGFPPLEGKVDSEDDIMLPLLYPLACYNGTRPWRSILIKMKAESRIVLYKTKGYIECY